MSKPVVCTAAAASATVDPKARTITGLIVPFGKPGRTSLGRLQFDQDSVRVARADRMKLLIEHDANRAVGHADELWLGEVDGVQGLVGRFNVDEGPLGDAALAQARSKSRDGLSIGIELDDTVMSALMRNPNVAAGTLARGLGRETSLVAVPAFDDSRVTESAAPQTPSAAAAGYPMQGDTAMPKLATTSAAAIATAAGEQTPVGDQGGQAQAAAPAPQTAAPAAEAAAPIGAQASGTPAPTAAPRAAAGAALHVSEPPVYTFDGQGDSFARDLLARREDDDREAGARLQKFSRSMDDASSAQVATFAGFAARVQPDGRLATAAVDTRTTQGNDLIDGGYRPDLIVSAIDKGRPMIRHISRLPLANANPFRLPVIGDFDGVGTHTEGTASVAEGTQTVDSQTVTPRSVSGAWRGSRELIEGTGPNIDRIVLAEMIKDWRRDTEAGLVAALELARSTYDAASLTTGTLLEGELIDFFVDRTEAPSVLGMSSTAFKQFAGEDAGDGRKRYPMLNPSNASGTSAPGFMSLNIQGVPGELAWSALAGDVWAVNGADVVHAESTPRTFKFEEVEGPGIIKLAIWGYAADHVYRALGVKRYKIGA